MVQILDDRRDVLGSIGKGIGQGLSDQLPKEIERYRLSQGLKQFEQDSSKLTPIQQLARLSAIPGITPQMVQSFGELGKQQAKATAIANLQNQDRPSPFPQTQTSPTEQPGSDIPSLTQEEPFKKAQEGYIPPTQEQIYKEAGEAYNANPGLFNNNPDNAIRWAEDKAIREEKINEAYQKKHDNLTRIQDNVANRLKDYSNNLGVKIPANIYSRIEDKAIQATKPKDQGGRGLTEQQAMKEYGRELDEISRDYNAIKSIGNWSITGRTPSATLRNLKALQKKFSERNDTENFADTLISQSKLSPIFAYSIAEPVSQVPELNAKISKLLPIHRTKSEDPAYETLLIAPSLAQSLGQKGSPLAVAYELRKKGYDPEIWLQYLVRNRENLGLLESQGRQLDKPNSLLGTLNDWWLSSWSGLEEVQ